MYPVAGVPAMAKRSGAKLCIVNLEPTGLDSVADVVVEGKAGEVLPRILDRVKEMEV